MKIARMIAAVGLMVASVGTATVADAQHRGDRYERHHDDRGRHGFRDDRRGHGYRNDRRGYRGNRGNRCHIERHHGRSVRVCR